MYILNIHVQFTYLVFNLLTALLCHVTCALTRNGVCACAEAPMRHSYCTLDAVVVEDFLICVFAVVISTLCLKTANYSNERKLACTLQFGCVGSCNGLHRVRSNDSRPNT